MDSWGGGYEYNPGSYEYGDNNSGSGWGSSNSKYSSNDRSNSSKTKYYSLNADTDLTLFDDKTNNISRYTCRSYNGNQAGLDYVLVTGYINGKRTKCIQNYLLLTTN